MPISYSGVQDLGLPVPELTAPGLCNDSYARVGSDGGLLKGGTTIFFYLILTNFIFASF